MLRFLADEDFDQRILRGLLLREPSLEALTVQEAGRGGEDDPANLGFAALENRILLTHDRHLVPCVWNRVAAAQPMPGVFIVPHDAPIGAIVDDLLDLALFSLPGEWEGRILFLPLR